MSDVPPSGLCQCGCGRTTEVAAKTDRRDGHVKGKPKPFYPYHARRPGGLAARLEHAYEVDPETGCWTWLESVTGAGYGQVRSPDEGRTVFAHRLFYERAKGPIPEGLTLDHLCRNPSCVNPEHMEPVTNAENIRRGFRHRFGHLVADVRRRHAEGASIHAIAREFGIGPAPVRSIVERAAWAADPEAPNNLRGGDAV